MAQEIEFRISADGKIEFETFGIIGQESCSKTKEQVMQSLSVGGDVFEDDSRKKPEFWKSNSVFTKAMG